VRKEDILRRAQAENKDEREEQVLIKSFKIGWYGILFTLLLIYSLQFYFDQPNSTALNLLLLAHLTATTFYQYKKLNLNNYLIATFILLGGMVMGFTALLSQYGVLNSI